MLRTLFISLSVMTASSLVGCDCLERVKCLQAEAEMRMEYVERYSHYAGDTWYWTGQCNAYNDVVSELEFSK